MVTIDSDVDLVEAFNWMIQKQNNNVLYLFILERKDSSKLLAITDLFFKLSLKDKTPENGMYVLRCVLHFSHVLL